MSMDNEGEYEIRRFLEMPSSEIGLDLSDLSEDDDVVDTDPLYQPTLSVSESESDLDLDCNTLLLEEVSDLDIVEEQNLPGPSR
ncbi:hypothetical protein J6590_089017, partial [Homalodisca vitripennis]